MVARWAGLALLLLSGCTNEPSVCIPKTVTIQLFGDSTQAGYDGMTKRRIAISPAMLLQAHLDRLFGTEAVRVMARGANNTTSGQLLRGEDGVNLPWDRAATADIIVVNHGINDQRTGVPLHEFKANLQALAPTVFQTPNPTPALPTAGYAAAVREVARGKPLADVDAYVRSLPDWQRLLPDGLHPSEALYGMISANVLLPAVLPLVERLRCEQAH